MAIGNAQNAGLLAVQMLGSQDASLLQQIQQYRQDLKDSVLEKQQRLDELGAAAICNSNDSQA